MNCSLENRNKNHLESHLKLKHNMEMTFNCYSIVSRKRIKGTYKCKECETSFVRKDSLKRHMNRVHFKIKPLKKLTCNECEASFEQKQQIESHINSVHLNERPYKQPGYADLEPQFTLKKKDGERLSYICNLCKPKNSVISVNVKSRSNLKRHLNSQHSKRDVEN